MSKKFLIRLELDQHIFRYRCWYMAEDTLHSLSNILLEQSWPVLRWVTLCKISHHHIQRCLVDFLPGQSLSDCLSENMQKRRGYGSYKKEISSNPSKSVSLKSLGNDILSACHTNINRIFELIFISCVIMIELLRYMTF